MKIKFLIFFYNLYGLIQRIRLVIEWLTLSGINWIKYFLFELHFSSLFGSFLRFDWNLVFSRDPCQDTFRLIGLELEGCWLWVSQFVRYHSQLILWFKFRTGPHTVLYKWLFPTRSFQKSRHRLIPCMFLLAWFRGPSNGEYQFYDWISCDRSSS